MVNDKIRFIEERNKRVESDKAWEISFTRRFIIAIITYFVVVLFLYIINVGKPWLNALVPTGGYILSTLTLSFVKKWWLDKHNKKS